MKIEFTKEDIEQIRRIARQEIQRFWYSVNNEMLEKAEQDFKQEIEGK